MTSIAEKNIKRTTAERNLIPKNGHVVIGLSGGPDSMCLFDVLCQMREELVFDMSAVHLNHRFRPGDAEVDQKFVEVLCEKMGIYCYSKIVDVNEAAAGRGETPEEAGRNERYTAFDEEALRIEKGGIQKEKIVIAVAQNRNDRIETVLMRILRGTGSDGLSGIPYRRKSEAGFEIVRPLLDTDRKDIEDYCNAHALSPRIDHTNSETAYNRNRIRLDLLPKLKSEYNYNVEDAILRLSTIAASDKEYFEELVEGLLSEDCEFSTDNEGKMRKAKIRTDLLNRNHPSVSRRTVIYILKKLGLTQGVEATHVDAAMNILERNVTGKIVEFPSGYIMKIAYGYAEFYNDPGTYVPKPEERPAVTIEIEKIQDKKEIKLADGKLIIKRGDHSKEPSDRYRILLDQELLMTAGNTIEIRYRKPGDRISIKGINGNKKLQDLFVDEKIPGDMRDRIPIVVAGSDILWVAGIRKSDKYTISGNVKDCLLLEWKPNN